MDMNSCFYATDVVKILLLCRGTYKLLHINVIAVYCLENTAFVVWNRSWHRLAIPRWDTQVWHLQDQCERWIVQSAGAADICNTIKTFPTILYFGRKMLLSRMNTMTSVIIIRKSSLLCSGMSTQLCSINNTRKLTCPSRYHIEWNRYKSQTQC